MNDPAPTPETGVRKSRIHSVLTALPLLMVIIGVSYHFSQEKQQRESQLLLDESIQMSGIVEGLSELQPLTGNQGKHFFWFESEGSKRGGRVTQANSLLLGGLPAGDPVDVWLAPTVPGSRTKWVYQVRHQGVDLLPEPGSTDNQSKGVTDDTAS